MNARDTAAPPRRAVEWPGHSELAQGSLLVAQHLPERASGCRFLDLPAEEVTVPDYVPRHLRADSPARRDQPVALPEPVAEPAPVLVDFPAFAFPHPADYAAQRVPAEEYVATIEDRTEPVLPSVQLPRLFGRRIDASRLSS